MSKDTMPRIEYKKILYATDLSEAGRQAFPHAASLANAYGAELTVFHVVEKRDFEKYLVGYINDDIWAEIKTRNLQEARELLVTRKRNDAAIKDDVDQQCQDVMSNSDETPYVTYDIKIDSGDAVEKIVEVAEQGGYDLIVIGKQGEGLRSNRMLGNTVRRVIRYSSVPVFAVEIR